MKKRNMLRAFLIIGVVIFIIGGVIFYGLSHEKKTIEEINEHTTSVIELASTAGFIAKTPLEEVYLSFVEFENESEFSLEKKEVVLDGDLKIVVEGSINMLNLDGDDHTNQPDLRQLWVQDIEVENTSNVAIMLTQENFTIDVNGVKSTAHDIFEDEKAGRFDSQSFPCKLSPGEKRQLHLAFGFTLPRISVYLDGEERVSDEMRAQYAYETQIKVNYNGSEALLSESGGSTVDVFRDKP